MIEHKSLFYNLNYPGPREPGSPGERLDELLNEQLRDGWVPYAAIPAGGDTHAGYVLMTRTALVDTRIPSTPPTR